MKTKIRAAAYTQHGVDVQKLFKFLDRDNNGTLNFEEFCAAIRRGRITSSRLSDDQLQSLFLSIDTDKSGTICVEEFVHFVGEAEGGSGTTATAGWKPRIQAPHFSEAELDEVKRNLRAAAYTIHGVNLRKLFCFLDKDREGKLDFQEFCRGVRRGRITKARLTDAQLQYLFSLVDCDHSGRIDVNELADFVGEQSDSRATWKAPNYGRSKAMANSEAGGELALGPAWTRGSEKHGPAVEESRALRYRMEAGQEHRELAALGLTRAGAPTVGRRNSLLLPPTMLQSEAAQYDLLVRKERAREIGLTLRGAQDSPRGGLPQQDAQLAERLQHLEDAIDEAENKLEHQERILKESWEGTRTKTHWSRRWEGYKPQSPWKSLQRQFPGNDRWGNPYRGAVVWKDPSPNGRHGIC